VNLGPKRHENDHQGGCLHRFCGTGLGQADVPALLRRVAETIEGWGEVEILDLVLHNDITAAGDWPSITVYHKTSS
jgi:hypothetical protein